MQSRIDYIVERCRGARVLHVGCCDAPFCAEKAGTGELLHLKLLNVAAELWGLDVAEESVTYLRTVMKIDNLIVGDAEELDKYVGKRRFDIIVVSEVLEHVLNPGRLLRSARRLLGPGQIVLITVPNGVAFRKGINSLFRRETVHPDHNFYFSRKTITELLRKCGYLVKGLRGYEVEARFGKAVILDKIAACFSEFACEGLIVEAAADEIQR